LYFENFTCNDIAQKPIFFFKSTTDCPGCLFSESRLIIILLSAELLFDILVERVRAKVAMLRRWPERAELFLYFLGQFKLGMLLLQETHSNFISVKTRYARMLSNHGFLFGIWLGRRV
jgi:glutaredoxin-related protein